MCSHERDQPEVLVEEARWAEDAGFDAVVTSDVFHPWVDAGGAAGFAWSWLGAVAATTERVELITTVTSPAFRYHPAVVAQAAATVSRLSGGRFVLGVGTGDPMSDAPFRARAASWAERAARLAEAVDVIRRLWAGQTVTSDGPIFPLDGARLHSPPLQPMRLWMGAAGPRAAALAAEIADGIVTSVRGVEDSRRSVIGPYRSKSSGGGSVMATRWAVLGADVEEQWRALGPLRGLRVAPRAVSVDPADLRRRADAAGAEQVLADYAVARDAAELVQAYRPLVDRLGADYVSIQVASTDARRTIQMLGAEVLPELRGRR